MFTDPDYLGIRRDLPAYLRPVITVAYHTGMRLKEVLGLQWKQVDLLSRTIWLSSQSTKNKKPRMAKLGAGEFYETIKMQREIRDAKYPDCPWVFFREGKQIKSFYKAWKSACTRAGVSFLDNGVVRLPYFHDLRRTAARELRRAGVSEGVIMKIAGWETHSMFDRYQIKDEQDYVDAQARRDEMLAARRSQSLVQAGRDEQDKATAIH